MARHYNGSLASPPWIGRAGETGFLINFFALFGLKRWVWPNKKSSLAITCHSLCCIVKPGPIFDRKNIRCRIRYGNSKKPARQLLESLLQSVSPQCMAAWGHRVGQWPSSIIKYDQSEIASITDDV